jgi:1-deoxy-D-xylulose-5-phosphate synthase
MLHDVALPCLPVVLALDRSGAVGDDGETHQGIYDIALFRSFPNLSILAPSSASELGLFLEWALDSGRPAVLRYPKGLCPPEDPAFAEPVVAGRGVFVRRWGSETLIVALGALVAPALAAAEVLHQEALAPSNLELSRGGVAPSNLELSRGGADLYSLRFARPFDEEAFLEAASPYARVLVVEEGVATGGFGEYLVSLIASRLPRALPFAAGFPAIPLPQGSRDELLCLAGLDASGIASRVRRAEASDTQGRIFVFRAEGEGA